MIMYTASFTKITPKNDADTAMITVTYHGRGEPQLSSSRLRMKPQSSLDPPCGEHAFMEMAPQITALADVPTRTTTKSTTSSTEAAAAAAQQLEPSLGLSCPTNALLYTILSYCGCTYKDHHQQHQQQQQVQNLWDYLALSGLTVVVF
jgi:hypothetical protein